MNLYNAKIQASTASRSINVYLYVTMTFSLLLIFWQQHQHYTNTNNIKLSNYSIGFVTFIFFSWGYHFTLTHLRSFPYEQMVDFNLKTAWITHISYGGFLLYSKHMSSPTHCFVYYDIKLYIWSLIFRNNIFLISVCTLIIDIYDVSKRKKTKVFRSN